MRVQVDNFLACDRLRNGQRNIALGQCFHVWRLAAAARARSFIYGRAAPPAAHLHATPPDDTETFLLQRTSSYLTPPPVPEFLLLLFLLLLLLLLILLLTQHNSTLRKSRTRHKPSVVCTQSTHDYAGPETSGPR